MPVINYIKIFNGLVIINTYLSQEMTYLSQEMTYLSQEMTACIHPLLTMPIHINAPLWVDNACDGRFFSD